MSYQTLVRNKLKRHTEQYYLQEKITYQKDDKEILKDAVGNIIRKDDVGNISETWEDVLELEGVIQHRQDDKITNA